MIDKLVGEKKKPKKFVFQINSENVSFIESLSYQDKHYLINQLISGYQNNESSNNQVKNESLWLKKFIAFAVVIVIGVPLLLLLLSFSLTQTKNSYLYMQKNFEKVYPARQTEKNVY